MALLGGLQAELQSAAANKPHVLSFATARAAANDTLFEIWNGTTNASRKFLVDLDGKMYSAALTAGDLIYAVTGGVTGVRRLDSLAKGAAFQQLRMNSGATAPEWGSGRITTGTTAVSTSGTGEDDLISYALPAATLGTNGQAVRITAWGTFTPTNDAVVVRLYFGATVLHSYGISIPAATRTWVFRALVVRTGAATQKAWVGTDTTDSGAVDLATPTETLSGVVTIKCTGQCTNAADSATQQGLIVEYLG